MLLFGLCLSVFLVQADTSIVNLALYAIGNDFSVTQSYLQWIIDSYNISYAALLLSGGFLSDSFGRKKIFLIGVFILFISSVLCSVSTTAIELIVYRAIAGLSSALIIPSSMAIVTKIYKSSKERANAFSIWMGFNGIALATAPTIGGLLIQDFSWRGIFYFVIPFCLLSFFIVLLMFKDKKIEGKKGNIKLTEQLLYFILFISFTVGIIESHKNHALLTIILPISIASLLIIVFIIKKRKEEALIPLSFFKNKNLRHSVLGSFSMTFGMYGILFLLPLYWQSFDSFTPLNTSVKLLPMSLSFIIVTIFMKGANFPESNKIKYGILSIGIGIIIISIFPDTTIPASIGLALTGVGMGTAAGPLMNIGISSTPKDKSGMASSVINCSRMLGAAFGVAILGSLNTIIQSMSLKLIIPLSIAVFLQFIFILKSRAEHD